MDLLNFSKDIIMSIRQEKREGRSNKHEFYQKIYAELFDYNKKVEDERYNDEFLMVSGVELAIEGLEKIVDLVPKLFVLPYADRIDTEIKQKLNQLLNQAKNDLRYYQDEWEEDNDDPSIEIIDSIILIYKEAEDIVIK